MAYDERLAERIRRAFARRSDITEKKMFGGLTLLCHGRMCCGINGGDLVVRVIAEDLPRAMTDPHVRPMDFTGRPLEGFVYVSRDGYKTSQQLRRWLDCGLRFATQGVARPGGSSGQRKK